MCVYVVLIKPLVQLIEFTEVFFSLFVDAFFSDSSEDFPAGGKVIFINSNI
jgi:hypothetical protein